MVWADQAILMLTLWQHLPLATGHNEDKITFELERVRDAIVRNFSLRTINKTKEALHGTKLP